MKSRKTPKTSLEHIKDNVSRITRSGEPVAWARRLSVERWGAFDGDDRRLTTLEFPRPQDVCDWWKALH